MHRTKTDAEMESAAAAYADDPERADLIERARRFKASWIELGEALTRVRRSAQWKSWGFESFEEYAKKELHLRPETAEKLTGSFQFLQRRAPELLKRDSGTTNIPSYQAVDFLRRAEEKQAAPTEALDGLRKRVLEDAAPLATVSRQFREVVFPESAEDRKARDAAGLKNVAKRLRELLAETRAVPRRLAGEVQTALDQLLEALGEGKSEEEAA